MIKKLLIVVFILLGLLTLGGIFLFLKQNLQSREMFFQDEDIPNISKPASKSLAVYGYLPYWTVNKAFFSPTMTTVSYFSLAIQADGTLLDLPAKAQEPGYRSYQNDVLAKLRSQIRSDQTLDLTITMMDQESIPIFLSNVAAQDNFLTDIEKLIKTQPIDGINIDIEYNGLVDDTLQTNLTTLLHRTNTLLKKQNPPRRLSIATYADAGSLQRLTHLKSIASQVDYVIMMAYDFHRSKSPNAGPNSPLYGKSSGRWAEDIMGDLKLYTEYVPAEKILLGVPFYGYAWSVEDGADPNSFTLPRSGESVPYTNILKLLAKDDVVRHWDTQAFSPYLTYSVGQTSKILYYDDPESLSYKMTLVRQAGLGGIAIWALGYDGGHEELWMTLGAH